MRERVVQPGLTVSVVGVGCNNFGWRLEAWQAADVVDAALEAGITLFDTAESYGDGQSEKFLGLALGARRSRAVIATKFGWGRGFSDNAIARGHPDYVRSAIEGSLRRLGTDYVDLYQYHRPDGATPIEETLGAMNDLVDEGKVRFIGSSNFSAVQVAAADAASAERGLTRFVTAQNKYSWLERGAEDELIPECERLGIALIPYFPLASGLLTGKYHRGAPEPEGTRLSGRLEVSDEQWGRIEALESFAASRELSLLDVAIGGLAAQPAVCSVIAGAMSPEQVRANAAAGAWAPSVAELERASFALSSEQWEAMAPRWERGRELLWRSTAAVSHWLVHRLAPQQGQTILELSAGLGETGFLAAPLLGLRGLLISSDREPRMVEAAARLGSERGVANAEFRRLEAERIQLPDASVDGVLSRFGYILKDDPPPALAEIRRVLRPGGRLAFSVWAARERNTWMTVPADALVERGRLAPQSQTEQRLSARRNADSIAAAVAAAGFGEPEIEEMAITYRFKDAGELWFFVSELRGPVALALAELPEAERAEIRAEIESRAAALDGYELGGVSLNVAVA